MFRGFLMLGRRIYIYVYTAEPLVSEPSLDEVEIAVDN
jgi:hypothetical protein